MPAQPGRGHGPALPQPRRARRGIRQGRVAIEGWAALGFGFVELGTVTPRPQPGNPRPRLFRLPRDRALINRMGFNNAGAEALADRIPDARPRLPDGFVIGVNIGRNRDGDIDDYSAAARAVADVADYLAINVSSPNTPGLRDLEDPDRLRELARRSATPRRRSPLAREAVARPDPQPRARTRPRAVRGRARRDPQQHHHRPGRPASAAGAESGGLSGARCGPPCSGPCAETRRVGGRTGDLASGGIGSGADAAAALEAGADLVQLWTGMIYAGPGLIGEAISASRDAPC